METKLPIGECGKWTVDPPAGSITPRKMIGTIGKWNVLIAAGKYAAQIFEHPDKQTTFNLFFPEQSQAITWMANSYRQPSLEQIESELSECQWGSASIPGRQKWLNLRQ